MADWTHNTYYFGQIPSEKELKYLNDTDQNTFYGETNSILTSIEFIKTGHEGYFDKFAIMSPVVVASWWGRWHSPIPITKDSLEKLYQDVFILEGVQESDNEFINYLLIVINGIEVSRQTADEIYHYVGDDADHDEVTREFFRFAGRTPGEQYFFKKFWSAYDENKCGTKWNDSSGSPVCINEKISEFKAKKKSKTNSFNCIKRV